MTFGKYPRRPHLSGTGLAWRTSADDNSCGCKIAGDFALGLEDDGHTVFSIDLEPLDEGFTGNEFGKE